MNGLTGLMGMAESGNPAVLKAAGRLFGFGQAEQQALVTGSVSKWTVFGIAIVAGTIFGIYAQRTWPNYAAKIFPR